MVPGIKVGSPVMDEILLGSCLQFQEEHGHLSAGYRVVRTVGAVGAASSDSVNCGPFDSVEVRVVYGNKTVLYISYTPESPIRRESYQCRDEN